MILWWVYVRVTLFCVRTTILFNKLNLKIMQIKTNDGTYNIGSNGKTNTALGLGIAGLATALLGGGGIFGYSGNGGNGDSWQFCKCNNQNAMPAVQSYFCQ